MRRLTVLFALLLIVAAPSASAATSAHDFGFEAIEGGPLPLSRFAGQAVLIVNTASFCGFTPQYRGLQALWQRYQARGLVVLGVPSNDFGNQEPGKAEEIKQFCEVNYQIDFPLADKVRVRGADAHPFYRWARAKLGAKNAPSWNFHKYLVAPDGRLLAAFPSRVRPDAPALTAAIEAALPD